MTPSAYPPRITLTTDFGESDHYVAVMKGVILCRCPDALIVDITHQLPPFSVLAGAYTVSQAAGYFPPGTIHVVVVDPGVGTSRKALLVEAQAQRFIAPDNGVLSFILQRDAGAVVRELSNPALFLADVSSTFHGRDIFSAAAGALAAGTAEPGDAGPLLETAEILPGLQPRREKDVWHGMVLSVDHFGNVVTNLATKEFEWMRAEGFEIAVGGTVIHAWHATFGAAPRGVAFAYFGSSGYVELGLNGANAAKLWNLVPGTRLEFSRGRRTASLSP